MSSSESTLPVEVDCGSFPIVSDESRLRDAGTSGETTSGAPVGCWANEANPKSDDTTQLVPSELNPAGCRQDEQRQLEVASEDSGTLSVNAPGGMSDLSSAEPTPSANAIRSRRDFEAFLRTHGFSRAAAKAIAANGWQSIGEDEPECEPDPDELTPEQAEQLLALFKV